jgi:hypothetical protein
VGPQARDLINTTPADLRTKEQLAPVADALNQYIKTLSAVCPGLASNTRKGYDVPFAKVVVGGQKGEPIDVILL